MVSRLLFILIAAFWIVMNVLLWRAEFGRRSGETSPVPASRVWEKLLTCPDSSSLSIGYRGKKVGFCHWITSVGEQWATVTDENMPRGVPAKARLYQLSIQGTVVPPDTTDRIRFEGTLKIDRSQEWRELKLRISTNPTTSYEVHAVAADQAIQFVASEAGTRSERTIRFSDLRNPAALMRDWIGPIAGASELLAELELPVNSRQLATFKPGVKWEAFEDAVNVGHSRVRVYRIQTRLFDRYTVSIVVSRVGEIVRVELPGDVVLVNDELAVL